MFEHTSAVIDLGQALDDLAKDQAEWSQKTFGNDEDRGPVGALRHLEKEAVEAVEVCSSNSPHEEVEEELADCLLLLLDAARRAGVGPMALIKAGQRKMKVNKCRTWPTPQDDTPVEHVR